MRQYIQHKLDSMSNDKRETVLWCATIFAVAVGIVAAWIICGGILAAFITITR